MIFKVREMSQTASSSRLSAHKASPGMVLSITGVDHDYDYLDEAFSKQKDLERAGTMSLITVTMGGMFIEAAPIITAIKHEARTRLYAAWKPLHPDEDDSAFTAFLDTPEGIEENRVYRRAVVDEMAGRSR